MKKFLSIIIALFSLNASSQIKNIAEKLGYEKDAKLLIIHGDDIGVSDFPSENYQTTPNNIGGWTAENDPYYDEYYP